MINTIIVFSDFINLPKFYIVAGDYSHLDGVVINCEDDEEKDSELTELMYNSEGYVKQTEVSPDEIDIAGKYVWINCGFAP